MIGRPTERESPSGRLLGNRGLASSCAGQLSEESLRGVTDARSYQQDAQPYRSGRVKQL